MIIASFAGVRGSITLAGILTLPLTLNGAPLPGRDIALVVAAGVVILSIAVANLVLPRLLAGMTLPPEDEAARFERRARKAAALAAIDAIERASHEEHSISASTVTWMEAAARVSADYRARIEGISKTGEEAEDLRRAEAVDRALRLAALRAERQTYFRLGRQRKLSDAIVRQLVAEIEHGGDPPRDVRGGRPQRNRSRRCSGLRSGWGGAGAGWVAARPRVSPPAWSRRRPSASPAAAGGG